MLKKLSLTLVAVIATALQCLAIDNHGITSEKISPDGFTLIHNGIPTPILFDINDAKGVSHAASNLCADFERVCGNVPTALQLPSEKRLIIVGTTQSKYVSDLAKAGKIDIGDLSGCNEKYIMTVVDNPFDGVEQALVIAGSDRRGTIYGIYELSEQIGVSPWYWWADVPVQKHTDLSIRRGTYTAGSPTVTYRGIFLNDEAPCLTSWVKNTYGTEYGGHEFYEKVFELILRLRGNFLWPAMWGWAFYADDPENSRLADEMGVIIGTSHHEPMGRNHQEWARHRGEYGAWNYKTNAKVIDKFFTEGIRRIKNTEDVVTIGMRGDGDEAMSAEADVALLEKIIKNQRNIIKKETGRPAAETPQVWALYKEVLDYYDKGLRVPDDVILLLCDDNWGNVRRLPNDRERQHPGGWGMYYHVDYVGAPRNTKWINVTPIQGMWEQLNLTHEYGVDKLWVLNVGDLKPMEYPITLFLDMAWNPEKYNAYTFMQHPRQFCSQIFGKEQGDEAARILNLYSKYNGRVTPEMLDASTYNLESGEWRQVRDDYLTLETDALRQFMSLPEEYRDAYRQLILFPVQACANLYDMYYSVAMNRALHAAGNPECNAWGERARRCFERDARLCREYNEEMSAGKWRGMMTQKHIGYTSWNDDFPADRMPEVKSLNFMQGGPGGYIFTGENGVVSIEAPHFFAATAPADGARWTTINDIGRTLGGVTLMPRRADAEGARIDYRASIPADADSVDVYVVVKSTLAFANLNGHRYSVAIDDCQPEVVNFNHNLNEAPQNIYSVFYPTVARRVVANKVRLPLKIKQGGLHTITLRPLDPGVVFEKIVVDYGGYTPSYLFMPESPVRKK